MTAIRETRAFGRDELMPLAEAEDHPVAKEVLALEVDVLLQHVLGLSLAQLLSRLDEPMSEQAASEFWTLLRRRKAREPVAYLVGRKEFYGLSLKVCPDVLIPRPETELLVNLTLTELVRREEQVALFDVGTGSGAIILAVLSELKRMNLMHKVAFAQASDICPAALDIAYDNSLALGLEDRINFATADLLEGLPEPGSPGFELIVSNPPYVPSFSVLAPDVRDFEPGRALYGGVSGVDIVLRLIEQFVSRGLEQSALLCEIGGVRLGEIEARAVQLGATIKFHKDLSGIDRFIEVRLGA